VNDNWNLASNGSAFHRQARDAVPSLQCLVLPGSQRSRSFSVRFSSRATWAMWWRPASWLPPVRCMHHSISVAILATVGTGLWAATTVAAEQERGTLAVLFWGPVDSIGYLIGSLAVCLCRIRSWLAPQSAFLVGVSLLTAFPLPAGFAWILLRCGEAEPPRSRWVSCCRACADGHGARCSCISLASSSGRAWVCCHLSCRSFPQPASVKEWLLAVSAARLAFPFWLLGRGMDGFGGRRTRDPGSQPCFTILYVGAMLTLAELCLNRKRRPSPVSRWIAASLLPCRSV